MLQLVVRILQPDFDQGPSHSSLSPRPYSLAKQIPSSRSRRRVVGCAAVARSASDLGAVFSSSLAVLITPPVPSLPSSLV